MLKLDRNTELGRAVDIMRICKHFDGQSKQVYFLFCNTIFSKRNRKHVLRVSIKL